jgi:uncharacterized protein (TIGR03437 family)
VNWRKLARKGPVAAVGVRQQTRRPGPRPRLRFAGVYLGFACFLTFTTVSPAYYYFTHFNGSNSPIYEKFDLTALPDKTVTYFIRDDSANLQLAPNDTWPGLVSEIRAAARVWNDVETSDIRLRFGGLIQPGTPQPSTPSITVLFDEVTPGLISTGAPTLRASFNGSFVPILQAVVTIAPEMSQRPSYSDTMFTTFVHEFGHTLGLQHTLTSSTMSTAYTRATTRSRPLADDDIAGLSLLYPAAKFAGTTGSITGRVTANGQGMNLASVVAISPGGSAVSAMTNPDGTYRIDGLEPQLYLIYVHPLPPAQFGESYPANIIPPLDQNRAQIAAGPQFDTQFYPGVRDPNQAQTKQVNAGGSVDGINFQVRTRSAAAINTVQTFSFPAQIAVYPPYLNPAISRPFVVASGNGLTANNGPVNGLSVSVLGGTQLPVQPYSQSPASYIQINVNVQSFLTANGPAHLIFTTPTDLYVLPSAFFQVQSQPPSVTGIQSGLDANGSPILLVSGAGLAPDTKVWFDGAAGTTTGFDASGRLMVVPPFAPVGYHANVVATNTDGQSSLALADAYQYTFGGITTFAAIASGITQITPSSLTAGTESLVEIDGAGTNWVDGSTVVGFGTSDIVVRRVWVFGPGRVLANVYVSPNAASIQTEVSVFSGLNQVTQPFAFQVMPLNSQIISISSQVVNAATGQPPLAPGYVGMLNVLSSPVPPSSLSLALSLSDKPVQILSVNGNQITFQIPAAIPTGIYLLRLDANGIRGQQVAISVDAAPPQITGVISGFTNQQVNANNPARAGDLIAVQVTGLADPGTLVATNRVVVNAGGIDNPAVQVIAVGSGHQIYIFLPPSVVPGNQVPVTVSVDGRVSPPFNIAVRGS